MMKNNNYLGKNYNKLKFDYGLDVVLLKSDEDLIELLLRELEKCREVVGDVEHLESEIEELKSEVLYLEGEVDRLKY